MGLKEDLADIIPPDALSHLSGHFDVIGDVVIISIPKELAGYKRTIAEAIISCRRNVYTVLNKVMKVAGDTRTAQYESLVGDTTITLHREFGFEYRLDVSKVFFNTRLSYERMRVIDQVEPGERVLVPFCGVGPFAIPAAAKGAHVVAIEKNPDAFCWLEENAGLNKVKENITLIEGDAFDTSIIPPHEYDRAIIPTPYGMNPILNVLSPFVVRDGIIHFYTFKTRREIPDLAGEYNKNGFDITFNQPCGNVAPGVSRWVFDLKKR